MRRTVDDPVDEAPASETVGDSKESVSDLLERLGRNLSTLTACEARLAAGRNKPALVRTAREVGAAAGVAFVFITAFVLANAGGVLALSTAMPAWLAALALAGAWAVVGLALAAFVRMRVRRASAGVRSTVDPEAARAKAEAAVRETLDLLVPALTTEIALAAVPFAGGVAGGLVDAGESLVTDAEESAEAALEEALSGGVVDQVVDVVLYPGRLGLRAATVVLRRNDSDD